MQNNKIRAERAQIFQPFDSLKGFREYLKEKERVVIKRKELFEDDYELLNRKLTMVQVGNIIKVVYYDKDAYVEIKGMVSKLDLEYRRGLYIVDTFIAVDDIISIEI